MLTLLKAVGLGLLVIVFTAGPWSIIAAVNLRTSPNLPWAGPVMAAYLWLAWLYARGAGPPASTQEVRMTLLRARPLTGEEWRNSLFAGVPAIASLWLIYAAVPIYNPLVTARPASEPLPVQSAAVAVLMSALVAAVSEEAGCRGYMQVYLERRVGPITAIVLSTGLFLLIHLSHGTGVLRLLPFYAAAGVVYGLMAYASNSIFPSLALHFVGDLLLFSIRAFHLGFWPQGSPGAWQNGYAFLLIAGALGMGLASVLAFRTLLNRRRVGLV
jgi:membrane protease YdiL (CAAX protease family)